jgi:2-octaprenyl-6-methoxyphenol hydroxylase
VIAGSNQGRDVAQATDIDIAVVGAGPTGLAAALALAHAGASVGLIGPAPASGSRHALDTRTAALLESSVGMLKALGVWDALLPHAAPLKAIRIIDASSNLFRAPDVEFSASELGLEAFGYNIANTALVEELYRHAAGVLPLLQPSNADTIALAPDRAHLSGKDWRIAARLVIGADGRNSLCREAARIPVSLEHDAQAAIAASFTHAELHRGMSVELHRQGGSVTTVPLTEARASSLIWVGETVEMEAMMRLDAKGFETALADRLDGVLGRIAEIGARAYFPVTRLAAESLIGPRTALVGEAAHVLPPIGAQGLNLGLRDVATLADCVADALTRGDDPGGEEALLAYDRARRLDVLTRSYGIDLLNRSLLSGFLPIRAARGIVSYGLNALPPLRRLVMRIGMEPPTELPSLMRPAAH